MKLLGCPLKRRIVPNRLKAALGAATRGRFLCNKMQRILDSGTVPLDPNSSNSRLPLQNILCLLQGGVS